MKTLQEFIREQEAKDPEFRASREASRPQFEFQRTLILARRGAGLTQKELAVRVGTTQSAISRLEMGDNYPRVEMLFKLASALNVTFEITPEKTIAAHTVEVAG
jgi:transcriptional regulator with XRE-family HTH domain